MTKILDFGKNKGKILAECTVSYLKWLATHEQVLAKRNRWAARDAKFLLEKRTQVVAQEVAIAEYEARKEAAMAVRIAEQLVRANVGTRAAHNTSRAFSLMR